MENKGKMYESDRLNYEEKIRALKLEINNLANNSSGQIKQLQGELENTIQKYENEIANLKSQHKDEITNLNVIFKQEKEEIIDDKDNKMEFYRKEMINRMNEMKEDFEDRIKVHNISIYIYIYLLETKSRAREREKQSKWSCKATGKRT